MDVLCLSLLLVCITCVLSSFTIILKIKRKLIVLPLLSYSCLVTVNFSVALPHDAVGWSAVCDCGIS